MSAPLHLTPDEATEFLDQLRGRGIIITLDGRAFDVEGPATETDREQLTAYAPAVVEALRRRAECAPQPESNDQPPAQPKTAPRPGVAPRAAPDPDPVIYAMPPHVTRRTASGRVVVERDGILVTAAYVHAYLDERDDDALKDFLAGRISKRDAYEWTADWIRQYVGLTGLPPRIHRDSYF